MTERRVEELLPWYVNGTLNDEERQQVESLLQSSEDARKELAILQQLSNEIQSESPTEFSELGWKRLQKKIREPEQRTDPGWWKPGLAAAATVIIALQVGIFTNILDPENDARLLSQGQPFLQEPHWIIQVEFSEQSTWGQLATLLDKVEGRVIDGPSSIGLIRIAVPESNLQFSSKDQVVNWLQQQPSVTHAALEE